MTNGLLFLVLLAAHHRQGLLLSFLFFLLSLLPLPRIAESSAEQRLQCGDAEVTSTAQRRQHGEEYS